MSDPSFGPDDPLSRDGVAAAVEAARPDWTLVAAEPIAEGSDVLYRVTVETGSSGTRTGGTETGETDTADPLTAILKCFRQSGPLTFRSAADFLTEVHLLKLVADETTVPVPDVYGTYSASDEGETSSTPDEPETASRATDLPTPLFLLEHVDGVNAEEAAVGTDPAVTERVARESGRYLARVHDSRSFDASGPVVARDGTLTVEDGYDEWAAHLRDDVAYALEHLDETRFADLADRIRAYTDRHLATFDPDVETTLLHGDYRRGNLLVDPDDGAIEAVIDWGATTAGDPLSELTTVEADLAGKVPPEAPLRQRCREALFEAYERERGHRFERDGEFEERVRTYRFVAWVTEMRWFPYWYAAASDGVRDERAAWLRDAVESAIDGE